MTDLMFTYHCRPRTLSSALSLGALMRNTGFLLANDAKKDRCKAVVGNLHRLGKF